MSVDSTTDKLGAIVKLKGILFFLRSECCFGPQNERYGALSKMATEYWRLVKASNRMETPLENYFRGTRANFPFTNYYAIDKKKHFFDLLTT